ncbi:MAG: hypothetical protein ACREHD_07140 [Pirellulales bacterium]
MKLARDEVKKAAGKPVSVVWAYPSNQRKGAQKPEPVPCDSTVLVPQQFRDVVQSDRYMHTTFLQPGEKRTSFFATVFVWTPVISGYFAQRR